MVIANFIDVFWGRVEDLQKESNVHWAPSPEEAPILDFFTFE